MKSKAQKRRHSTPQHRRSAWRRFINKTRLLLIVLGILSIVLGAFLALLALIQKQPLHQPIWQICAAYVAGGGVLLLLRWLLALPKRFRRRAPPSPPVSPESPAGETPLDRRSGMVLVLVLVVLGLTSALLLHVQHSARLTQRIDQRIWQEARLRVALTDEAFHRIRQLANDEDRAVDHLRKPWLGYLETERPDGITTISRVLDLNRFIDINNLVLGPDFTRANLTERFLVEAMTQAGDFTPIERIDALRDWINPGDDALWGTDFYMQRQPPYAVAGTWLYSWHELRWIEGFARDYFARQPLHQVGRPFSADIVELLAVVPGSRDQPIAVNINTAPSAVLASVFGPGAEHIARYIYIVRPDQPFRSIDALLAQADTALFAELSPFIDVRSTHFLIEVRAFEAGAAAGLRAVAHREQGGRVHILQWVL